MPVRFQHHAFSARQMGEMLTASGVHDVHLTFWERFKDIFIANTKRAEVERIVAQLHSARNKVEAFRMLRQLAKDTETHRFGIRLADPGPASLEQWFTIDGEVIARESHHETATGAAVISALSNIWLHLEDETANAGQRALQLLNGMRVTEDPAAVLRGYLGEVRLCDIFRVKPARQALLVAMEAAGVRLGPDLDALDLREVPFRHLRRCIGDWGGAHLKALHDKQILLQGTGLRDVMDAGVGIAGMNGVELEGLGVTLEGACLDGLDLSGMNFDRCNLRAATFAGARLDGCTFVQADLVSACFDGADLSNARFSTKPTGAAPALERTSEAIRRQYCAASVAGATFVGATLRNATMCGLDLAGRPLTGVVAERADFTHALLSGVSLESAVIKQGIFAGVRMNNAHMSGCNAEGADFSEANLAYANLERANLSGATLTRARLSDVRAERAVFEGARAVSAIFDDAHLPSASMRNAVLQSASLRRANLAGADLTDADVTSAELTMLNIEDASLIGLRGAEGWARLAGKPANAVMDAGRA